MCFHSVQFYCHYASTELYSQYMKHSSISVIKALICGLIQRILQAIKAGWVPAEPGSSQEFLPVILGTFMFVGLLNMAYFVLVKLSVLHSAKLLQDNFLLEKDLNAYMKLEYYAAYSCLFLTVQRPASGVN